jgi:hypothetical protein
MESRSEEARGNTSAGKLGAKKLNLGFFMGFSVVCGVWVIALERVMGTD